MKFTKNHAALIVSLILVVFLSSLLEVKPRSKGKGSFDILSVAGAISGYPSEKDFLLPNSLADEELLLPGTVEELEKRYIFNVKNFGKRVFDISDDELKLSPLVVKNELLQYENKRLIKFVTFWGEVYTVEPKDFPFNDLDPKSESRVKLLLQGPST